MIKTCCSRNLENNPLSAIQIIDGKSATIDWWNTLHKMLDDGSTLFKHFENQVKQLQGADEVIETLTKERSEKQTELNRLRDFAEKTVKLKTRRETANGTKKKAEEAIAQFDTENSQLIKEAAGEKHLLLKTRQSQMLTPLLSKR
jgi:Skp family chaperone for outer membrane proteins